MLLDSTLCYDIVKFNLLLFVIVSYPFIMEYNYVSGYIIGNNNQ